MNLLIPLKTVAFGVALAGAVYLGDFAAADEVPTGFGDVPYSAEQVITRAGGESVQKLHFTPGKLRIEGPWGLSFLDIANKRMWVKAPGAASYMAVPYDPAGFGISTEGTFKSEKVGEEAVDGFQTTKYRFEMKSGEMTGHGFYWLTADGIRIRQEGETKFSAADDSVPFTIVLRNLQLGPQDPSLFKLPGQ